MLASVITFLLASMLPAGDTLLPAAKVTALKESIPLERIASPVTTLRDSALSRTGIYRPNALSAQVPGLHIPEYGASLTSTIYLRGMGSRMENPVLGLYLDGIPVLDKNAYDFDWEGIKKAVMLRGPQGTLYGRNSMGGVLALESFSPSDGPGNTVHLEYGTANTLRLSTVFRAGNSVFAAHFRHTDGFFPNAFKGNNCDPYNGLSAHWKWERSARTNLHLSNTLWMNLSREGGFAYGQWDGSILAPVSYNDESRYSRLSVIEGFRARYNADSMTLDAAASLQLLSDDMLMDQDYTTAPVFTLQQKQLSGAGTFELRLTRADKNATWQPQTGIFSFYRLGHASAPVTFKRTGIEGLILSNANAHIPSDIGHLEIPDETFPVNSNFLTGSWNVALFHESIYSIGNWQFTAGLRLDYEGARMDYDCYSTLHYRFDPTMAVPKPYSMPYKGKKTHGRVELLPKASVLFRPNEHMTVFTIISKGYRSGGFNTQIFSDILQNLMMEGLMKDLGVYLDRPTASVSAGDTEYDPETAWNYEIGGRGGRGDFRAQLSAYALVVRKQQLTVFPPGMSTGRMMTNSGRSRSLGVEAELGWTPGNFRSRLCWSWCDARFLRYESGHVDYSGNGIPYIPRHTLYAGIGYTLGRIEADVAVRGAGPLWWNEENTLSEPFRPRLEARLALVFPKWEIYLRGENLTGTVGNTFYFKSVGNEFFASMRPRILLAGISIKL